jgi:phosphate uptake regulator
MEEIRKLQRTGGTSLTLTLPKKWTTDNKLSDKDLVKIIQESGRLVIQPTTYKGHPLVSTLCITDLSLNMIGRELVARYLVGVDEINIKSDKITQEQREYIRHQCQQLLGFELIDEASNEIFIKNVFDLTKFPISQNIEKMFLTAKSMAADALLAHNDLSLAKDIIDRDIEIDKLYMIIHRHLYSFMRGKETENDIPASLLDLNYYAGVATQLERIADHAVKIAKTFLLHGSPAGHIRSISFRKIQQTILPLFDETLEMVKELDKNAAHDMLNANQQIEQDLFDAVHKDAPTVIENVIGDSFDRTRGYFMNIAELTIDHVIAQESK